MRIYTRTGDSGETGLIGGTRVGKDAPRLEVCGTVDELNAQLGAVRSRPLPEELDKHLARIQHELFEVGAELATPDRTTLGTGTVGPNHVAAMEQAIDDFTVTLTPLRQFILPGGTPASAGLHLARAICRRAERRLVTLASREEENVSDRLLAYLNRLADFLFVAARAANADVKRPDVTWRGASNPAE